MSGGGLRYVHLKNPGELLTGAYDMDLREVAERIEAGNEWWMDQLPEQDREHLAALLREKADAIEAAREQLSDEFDHETSTLLKTIDRAATGDTGAEKVAADWYEHGESRDPGEKEQFRDV